MKIEKEIIKKEYETQMKKLGCCNKFYLWIRRHYVVDILFKRSEEELDDIVDQMENGRTSIKTALELGTHNQAKKERQHEVEQELNEIMLDYAKNQTREGNFIIPDKLLGNDSSLSDGSDDK